MNSRTTKADRDALLRVMNKREKVAKTAARRRTAELLAQFETDMQRHYSFMENDVWSEVHAKIQQATAEGAKLVDAECERLGIPKRFRPRPSSWWCGGGEASNKERVQLRILAQTQLDAQEKCAFEEIERASAEIQTELLRAGLETTEAHAIFDKMPTVDQLLPPLRFSDVQELFESKIKKINSQLGYHERITYSSDAD